MRSTCRRFRTILSAGALGALSLSVPAAAQTVALPELLVTMSRLSGGIVGASTSVITADDIARSPARTVQEILAREPGVQTQSLFGGVNGARTNVDLRGFGASATSNTLFLINGRRITDLDLVGFDLASLPRDSIERIEITRGNSGAVLYGDGAVGGVVNIVTKTGFAGPPQARIEGAFGSFNYKEANASVSSALGPWSARVFGNAISSDGYRVNNAYRQQNAVGDFRYAFDQGSAYVTLSADSQNLGLPGARRVDPVAGLNQLATDRRGARTPFDHADKDGLNATAGVTRMLLPGVELIVDGGVRHKQEQAAFYQSTPTVPSTAPLSATDTQMTTVSLTPRLKTEAALGGMAWKGLGGVDVYRAMYGSDRPQSLGGVPIHRYDLTQTSVAGYWQETVTVLPTTDVSFGARVQNTRIGARDAFDATAPGAVPVMCFPPFGCFGDLAGTPLDRSETNRAYHLGVEHRLTANVALFGRAAQSFRVPNVDERVGMITAMNAVPTTFDLRTQKSHDVEGGVRLNGGPLALQWSLYDMRLRDEIHFRFGPNFEANNINLDPTRRYGHETTASLRISDELQLKGGLAYTRAVFREGVFAGNDVPLVSRWTGSAGVAWNVWQKYLVVDGVVRYVGARRMDNDQTNLQPLIPEHLLVDVRVGGEYRQFFWSVAAQNLFDVRYYDYAIASPYPFGAGSQLNTYNAYPQPGRTVMVRAGATF